MMLMMMMMNNIKIKALVMMVVLLPLSGMELWIPITMLTIFTT